MKYLIGLILGFVLGFYVNSLLMIPPPQALLNLQDTTKENAARIEGVTTRKFPRTVFDGTQFKPDILTAQVGQKIEFVNESSTVLMKLQSSEKALRTPRGYGKLEYHSAVLMTQGEYTVSVEDAPTAHVKIIVNPL